MRRYDFYTETDMEGVKHHRVIAISELMASGYREDQITRLSLGID